MKSHLLVAILSAALLSACASTGSTQNDPMISKEMASFIERASNAISAYQNKDSEAWNKLVCLNPSKRSMEDIYSVVGKFEKPRIVSILDHASAANLGTEQNVRKIAFEGIAEKYPMDGNRMGLWFYSFDDSPQCLYISF